MNILKTHTCPTGQADTFLVYWTNSLLRPKGVLKVRIRAKIEDRHIAAELAAMQHLLEDKEVIGQNVVGNAGTQLIVSLGAIRKLQRRQSDKDHLASYANFLTTRFAGCQLSVDKDSRWFDGFQFDGVEDLLVSGPRREKVLINGLGEVSVTQHVLERFADRVLADNTPDRTAQLAWKRLTDLASDQSVREVFRHSLWTGAKYCQQGKQEGRYFLNPKRNLVMVVTDNPREGKRLVTTYPATRQFHEIRIAA
jgi:hypothetical protein